ncbi:MAG: tRNA modification GTPase [Gammaproteobacteria bacterium]|nr:tRNA modification GTPase [Gammaproteobacteria bacterium]
MISPDTIVAVASAAGRGAVAVVRVSGPLAPHVATGVLGALPAPRLAQFSRFLDAQGRSLDEGIALYFPAPASYTGEHVLELQGHGGALVVDMLLQRLLELGCRMARPGEFSERAFLNGKIDIAQAEAIADLIDAGTAAAARAAVRSLQGEFSARIADLKSRITDLRAYVEAAIDFPDEEIDFLSDKALRERLAAVFAAFESITTAARQGALLREGLNVVIAGKPNAGKSSLLNALAGDEVAIVTDVPGTTRDVLRQHVHLDGLPLNLIDTAGLRAAVDVAEVEGVRRARNEMTRADRVLYIVDAGTTGDGYSDAWAAELQQLPGGVPVTVVFNKIDLTDSAARLDEAAVPPRVFLSARTGAGLDLLRTHLKAAAGYRETESGALAARRRHLDALQRARQHVQSAADILSSTRAFELFAEDLRLAQHALGEITGEFTSEDLLGEIFGSFCIGK